MAFWSWAARSGFIDEAILAQGKLIQSIETILTFWLLCGLIYPYSNLLLKPPSIAAKSALPTNIRQR
jgi:hypothetical protein